jgi:hypothetical protein
VTDSSLCPCGGNIPGFGWRDWIHPQNPNDISSLDSGLNLWPAKYEAEVLPTQLWPSFRLLVSCNSTHITVTVNEGVATIETWKFTMPVLGWMVGTLLHVLEVVVVTRGSEDYCNINFCVMSTVPMLGWCLMMGSDHFCSYPCLIFVPVYNLTCDLHSLK